MNTYLKTAIIAVALTGATQALAGNPYGHTYNDGEHLYEKNGSTYTRLDINGVDGVDGINGADGQDADVTDLYEDWTAVKEALKKGSKEKSKDIQGGLATGIAIQQSTRFNGKNGVGVGVFGKEAAIAVGVANDSWSLGVSINSRKTLAVGFGKSF